MKSSIINLSLPSELLTKVDRQAEQEDRNRSELLREAVRIYLERKSRWESIFSYGDKQSRKKGLRLEDVPKAVSEARRS